MPIVIGPALRAAPFRLRGLVLFFFMAGLLLHFECAFHWELIASRRGSALSFHLCAVRVSSGTEPGTSATGLTDGLRIAADDGLTAPYGRGSEKSNVTAQRRN